MNINGARKRKAAQRRELLHLAPCRQDSAGLISSRYGLGRPRSQISSRTTKSRSSRPLTATSVAGVHRRAHSPRTLLLLLAAEPIPAFSRSSAPADHSSPWPVAPSQTGRGAWMIPLTRTVGVSTDREPVSDASPMRRGSLQVHGAVTFDNSEGEARRGRLEQMSRAHSLPMNAGAKNRPP